MNQYLIKSEGEWNHPSITSKTIGNSNGYIPKYSGGCFGIVPHNDKFIFFDEDDDHYWETITVNKQDLIDLQKIFTDIDNEISVKIDYIKAKSTQTYTESKELFLTKERSLGMWKVKIEDRGQHAPLVTINKDAFDVSHTKNRLKIINEVLALN